jgi:Zn-dependent protease
MLISLKILMESWMNFDFYSVLIAIVPIIFAITVHEFAHGWAAKRYGDNTAFLQGRLTLDPLNHIDLIGTILVPILTFATTGIIFGWAKPVPVNFSNLNNPRKDGIKVALAGPISNLIMAIGWSIIMTIVMLIATVAGPEIANIPIIDGAMHVAMYGISINILFCLFNLIPIPPLDGGRVLQLSLPPKYSYQLNFMEQYGMFIVMALGFMGVLGSIIRPLTSVLQEVILLIPGLVIWLAQSL